MRLTKKALTEYLEEKSKHIDAPREKDEKGYADALLKLAITPEYQAKNRNQKKKYRRKMQIRFGMRESFGFKKQNKVLEFIEGLKKQFDL